MRKLRLVLAGVAISVAITGVSPAMADVTAPGVCKKQGPSNCNGNSECAGPHRDQLPRGQQKKCS